MTSTDLHKYNTGIIGNCMFIAHVSTDTNISWMCWPYFDSSFIFGSLIDSEKGGEFTVKPVNPVSSRQYYIENTNILCTEFICKNGSYRVIDFAPRFFKSDRSFKPLMLFRKIELIDGEPQIQIICDVKYGYGQYSGKKNIGSNHISFFGTGFDTRLTTNVPLSFILSNRPFFLTKSMHLCLSQDYSIDSSIEDLTEEFLKKTIDYWRGWVRHSTICNFHQKEVIRSSLVLKLHQFEDTGAIIAASTTSLPEFPGSGRNWDYRYCWIRDAYYTLTAFANIGHGSELEKYAHFIQNVVIKEGERYAPVYDIRGNNDFDEQIIDLNGYMGNKPVRIGNQAMEHVQNDVYGQVIVSLLPLFTDERFTYDRLISATRLTYRVLDKIEETMNEPDAGLWEFRSNQREHCYTFLFHWAGCHAAKKISKHIGDEKLFEKASRLLVQSISKIESFYDENLMAYTQNKEQKTFDASLLHLITMNYLEPGSDKAKKHLEALEKHLSSGNEVWYRYIQEDDFGKPESSFFVCAFWYVEALACVGRVNEAVEKFGKLVNYGNHLGLFSEDVMPDGSQWGNFPQTYSHVGLVNAAFRIAHKIDEPNFFYYDGEKDR
jgi:GH15 family glucan-1,4-alpha-glucosidase